MQFCYSDTTFNFKLKSHARFSGRDRGRQLRAAEVSPFGAGRPRRKWVPARPVASGGTAAPTAREAARVVAEAEASSRCPPVGPPTGSTAAWGRAGPCAHTRTHAHPHTHACTHARTRGGTDALSRASGTGRGGAGGGDAAGTDAPPACLSHPWPLGHPSTVPCLSPGFVFRESALGRRAAPSRCSARPRARHTRLNGPARLQASPAPRRPPSPNRVPPDPRPGSTCRSAPPGVMAWARRGPSARSRAPGPPPSLRGPSGCVLSAAGAAAGWRRVDVCQIFTSLLNDAERPVEPPLGKPRTPNAERPVNPSTSPVPAAPRTPPPASLLPPPPARPPPWTPAPRSADSKARRRECPRPEGKGQRSPGEHVLHGGREKPAGLRARGSVARASLGRGPRARSRGGG